MNGVRKTILSSFFFMGERIGLVLIVLTFLGFFLYRNTDKAFSQDTPQFVTQDSEWYKKDSVKFSVQHKEYHSSSFTLSVATITPTPTPVITVTSDDVWIKLAECESHQNWSENTGNGYYGGLQFNVGAWQSVGGTGLPSEHSKDEQIEKGKALQAARGWGPWRNCAVRIGVL